MLSPACTVNCYFALLASAPHASIRRTFIACMTAGTSPARPPATYAASTLVCGRRDAFEPVCHSQQLGKQHAHHAGCFTAELQRSTTMQQGQRSHAQQQPQHAQHARQPRQPTCTSCPAPASPPCARNSWEYTPIASL